MQGFPRSDGRKGVRNVVVVVYLVECAHHVARQIAMPFGDRGVHLVGFAGCFPNAHAARVMRRIATHPNVGGCLLVSLGCESFDRHRLAEAVSASGRPVHTVVIQESGGTAGSIDAGRKWIESTLPLIGAIEKVEMSIDELVVGTICGGSDATSGLTANPAAGLAFDRLIQRGATGVFEETGELIGCEQLMVDRAADRPLGQDILAAIEKAARYYDAYGHGSFAPGNADGGLTTIEEKSLGAYSKSGRSPIVGLITPGDVPTGGGLYLLDVVPDGLPMFGFPNIADNAEIVELIACGCHLIVFTTGRGSVVGSAVSPVIKVCANPETYRKLSGDMDIDAGRILEGRGTLEEVGREIFQRIIDTADGQPTFSEQLGHQEFLLTYKRFEGRASGCTADLKDRRVIDEAQPPPGAGSRQPCESTHSDPCLIRLSEEDNIRVAAGPIEAGRAIIVEDETITAADRIPTGHKMAVAHIPDGAKVLKYGVSIGSATRDIRPGQYVHTHNLKSDYLPTYTLDGTSSFLPDD